MFANSCRQPPPQASLVKGHLSESTKPAWKSLQRVRNSSIDALRFLSSVQWGCRGGVCPLALGASSPLVPPRARPDRDGGFAVWFNSRGSIDSFKVESTCHCFNHPWPRLHVGSPQRGDGISSPVRVFVCEQSRGSKKKKKRKERRTGRYRERITKPKEIRWGERISHFSVLLSSNHVWVKIFSKLGPRFWNNTVFYSIQLRASLSHEAFLSGLNVLLVYLIRFLSRGRVEWISMQAQLMAAKLIQFIPKPFLRPRL